MRKVTLLLSLIGVLGTTSIFGCGLSGSNLSSSMVPVQDAAESGEVVTLYFDGNPVSFGINDLAIALALFLNPNASTEQIQQVATDIFGLSLTEAQITGAGPNPLANFDLNGDGTPGQIEDLGVALGVFLGQSTAAGVDQVCQDVLGFSCDVSPSASLPGPGATPFPNVTISPTPPTPGSSLVVNTLTDENGTGSDCSLREAIVT
ncbi:MAG: CSLREA domain-containing protein, partial [Synechococcaceae cyanobacterium RM1_1_27]|nr:CSLREA domain-containing protein [Synechococcaceae cyanobacterium RM1_1_27]